MILQKTKLTTKQNLDVKGLIAECCEYDTASSCIQIDHSMNFYKKMKNWYICYEKGNLIGISSIFSPMNDEAEISICVKPNYRNNGICTRLLNITQDEIDKYKIEKQFIVCDRKSKTGTDTIGKKKLQCHHVEYTLKYQKTIINHLKYVLEIREGKVSDIPDIANVCESAFGDSRDNALNFVKTSFESPGRESYVGIHENRIIASCFIVDEGEYKSITTLVVEKENQGKGIGKEFLYRILTEIIERNVAIQISVDSTNDKAYKLYKDIGFIGSEETGYYSLLKRSNGD
jgi:N-acetylglutamate synthase-like GNAT family acetyltransferase